MKKQLEAINIWLYTEYKIPWREQVSNKGLMENRDHKEMNTIRKRCSKLLGYRIKKKNLENFARYA